MATHERLGKIPIGLCGIIVSKYVTTISRCYDSLNSGYVYFGVLYSDSVLSSVMMLCYL